MNIPNKICLITGSTSGLGKAVAMNLASKGATVVITSKDHTSGEQVMAEIKQKTNNNKIDLLVVDFGNIQSIKDAAVKFKSKYQYLHILINCAAVYKKNREITSDGLESMFAINHLGYFLLTNQLLDIMKASSSSRVLNITAPSTVKLDFENLQGEKKFNSLMRFGASKMENLLFTFALARKLEGTGVGVNAIHPGLMKTTLMRESFVLVRILLSVISQSPEKAAESVVNVAINPEYEGKTGLFFRKGKEIKAPTYAYNQDAQEKLWDASLRLGTLA